MAESRIRWKQGDYITLGKAVANFNRKINKLNAEEKKLYLPDTLNYEEEKMLITTRRQLNNLVNSLKRFSIEGAEEKMTTKARRRNNSLGIQ